MIDKEDKAILALTNSIGLMSYMTLYDLFDFNVEQVKTYYAAMVSTKQAWSDGEISTEGMIKYCAAHDYDVTGITKSIPRQKKLLLCGKNYGANVLNYLDYGFLINIVMSCIVLTEEFDFTKEQINKYLDKIVYYVDSFTRKQPKSKKMYMDDKMVIDIFKDELGLDLVTGRTV